jgi:hypothetical protein
MKKLKMAKMKDKKVRGEWAEMKFMTCAVREWVVRQQALGRLEQLRFCGGASGALCGGAGEMHRL